MVAIPGGDYPIGTAAGGRSARPPHRVALEPFLIDAVEVTNAAFAAFLNSLEITPLRDVAAGALRPADVKGPDADRLWGGSDGNPRAFVEMDDSDARIAIAGGRLVAAPGYENRPAPESTWAGAVAFCAWRGARLPTEAEWEAAARGLEGRVYPWGAAPPTPARAVYARGRGETDPVGSHALGATPDGVFDLAGNLAEWTSSLYRPYPYDETDGREDPDATGERVTRGGDHVFDTAPDRLTATFRDGFSRDPGRGHRHIGFRCAKDAPRAARAPGSPGPGDRAACENISYRPLAVTVPACTRLIRAAGLAGEDLQRALRRRADAYYFGAAFLEEEAERTRALEQALADLDDAAAVAPEDDRPASPPIWLGPLHLARADVLFDLERFEEAAGEYGRALAAIEGEPPIARLGRALALGELRRFDEALADLSVLVNRHARAAKWVFLRAEMLERAGRAGAARADYAAVLARDPGHVGARRALDRLGPEPAGD